MSSGSSFTISGRTCRSACWPRVGAAGAGDLRQHLATDAARRGRRYRRQPGAPPLAGRWADMGAAGDTVAGDRDPADDAGQVMRPYELGSSVSGYSSKQEATMKLSRRDFVKRAGASTALAGLSSMGRSGAGSASRGARKAGRTRNPAHPRHTAAVPLGAVRQGCATHAGQAAAPARGRAERRHHPDRRHGLRRHQRLRRPDQHAHPRAGGERGPEVHPLPHHRALLADAPGAAHRPQPSLGRHGQHHRDGHHGARLQLDPPEHCGHHPGDPAAERLQHRRLRQDAPDAGLGGEHLRPLRPLADRRRL